MTQVNHASETWSRYGTMSPAISEGELKEVLLPACGGKKMCTEAVSAAWRGAVTC